MNIPQEAIDKAAEALAPKLASICNCGDCCNPDLAPAEAWKALPYPWIHDASYIGRIALEAGAEILKESWADFHLSSVLSFIDARLEQFPDYPVDSYPIRAAKKFLKQTGAEESWEKERTTGPPGRHDFEGEGMYCARCRWQRVFHINDPKLERA